MAWWIRSDARLFGIVFVVFNVLLAVFNILNYRVAGRATVPCVVIVAPTPPPLPPPGHRRQEPFRPPRPLPVTSARGQEALLVTAAARKFATTTTTTTTMPPSLYWTDTPTDGNTNSTPHTRRLVLNHNATILPDVPLLNVTNATLNWDVEQRDKYTVVKRYIPADGPTPAYDESVTLSTQGTYEFLRHIAVLCERWEGPLSVSVYAPGTDLPVAVRHILYLRRCGPPCVSLNVTWHLLYDTLMAPRPYLEAPYAAGEMELYEPINCTAGTRPLQLLSEIRNSRKMPYPINVARNVARQQAATRYVLASDIELYPSEHVVPRFLRLVTSMGGEGERRVFTLPIFEIKKELSAPRNKSELVKRVKAGQAIFFHKWVCDACQNFPRRDEWLRSAVDEQDHLGVFEVTKRHMPRTAWEPIYIGTNNEPFYDERLTWEGKRDKMSQMYELCLLDYDFHVLDSAFLVHAPGIKTLSDVDQRRRAPFMYKNNAVHNRLLAQMKKKYGPRKGC